MKKRIAFIINPISGGKSKKNIPTLIEQLMDKSRLEWDIFYTRSTEHNKELAAQCVNQKYDAIVAVGGDGTINNTAKYLVNTGIAFGIVPLGSGNGLARHLGLSTNPRKALQTINQLHCQQIDCGYANEHFFINVSGVGFDAHVTWKFAQAPKRGFLQYAKITLNEFSKYPAMEYTLTIDGKTSQEEAFLICVANGSQYGNNAYISPLSIVNDGQFEITIIKPFKLTQMPGLGYRIFRKNLHQSAQVKVFTGRHITITRNQPDVVNVDGEPVMMPQQVDINIIPNSIQIICNE